jgi:hypothetical protein
MPASFYSDDLLVTFCKYIEQAVYNGKPRLRNYLCNPLASMTT